LLSPGESIDILVPRDANSAPLTVGTPGGDGAAFDRQRRRIGAEICYCSTLDDCWTLRVRPGQRDSTSEARCPAPSARTFRR
jgi:hypothetical protein